MVGLLAKSKLLFGGGIILAIVLPVSFFLKNQIKGLSFQDRLVLSSFIESKKNEGLKNCHFLGKQEKFPLLLMCPVEGQVGHKKFFLYDSQDKKPKEAKGLEKKQGSLNIILVKMTNGESDKQIDNSDNFLTSSSFTSLTFDGCGFGSVTIEEKKETIVECDGATTDNRAKVRVKFEFKKFQI